MPVLIPLAASNTAILVVRGDELLVLDRGSAAVRVRHEIAAPLVAGTAGKDDLVVAVGAQILAFDRSGGRIACRNGEGVPSPRSLALIGGSYVLDDGTSLRVLGPDLAERRRLSRGVWGAGENVLVLATGGRRVDVYPNPGAEPFSVEVGGRPAGIVVAEKTAWVVCEGGFAYGVDLDKRRVRRFLDMQDIVPATLRTHGVGAIGLTEEASLTGWKLD